MFGNTHAVAEGIAEGLRPDAEVRTVPVGDATNDLVSWAELVIVGAPTHAHGMTRASSRRSASDTAARSGGTLTLDPSADGPGIRDWLASAGRVSDKSAAVFDTRVGGPPLLTGRASSGIASGLRRRGFRIAGKPESFLVDRSNRLVPGEVERARRWGAELALQLMPTG